MKYGEDFIRAYRAFRESVDFSTGGILPELDSLIWCMLAGVPEVPADEDTSPDAPLIAIYQRVAILKAVFVEVNGDQPEEFIDRGLLRYDRASEMAKKLLKEEANQEPDLD
jgi:hypothetical protein